MLLAEFNLIEHLNDHPWWQVHPWGEHGPTFTVMSSGIASMILVALALIIVVPVLARRRAAVPTGGRNVIEVVVIFVRDMIAKPALHGRAYQFLPFLCTLFLFLLGLNLMGVLPLSAISSIIKIDGKTYPIGYAATSTLTVTGAMAALTMVMVFFFSFKRQAEKFVEHHPRMPLVAALAISPVLWLHSLVPPVPGVAGRILYLPLMVLELFSMVMRCGALMIRLFANMTAGHSLLAVFMMFIVNAIAAGVGQLSYVGPLSLLGSTFVSLMEILVAGLQAYIFTFLTALFIGLYSEGAH